MRVPTWGTYLMWASSIVGAVLLTIELGRRGWPPPLSR
jgi:hypothetical protein